MRESPSLLPKSLCPLVLFSTTTATHIWFNPLRESQAAKASNLTANHSANTSAGMQTQPQPTITQTASLCWFGSAMGDCSQPTKPAAGNVVYSSSSQQKVEVEGGWLGGLPPRRLLFMAGGKVIVSCFVTKTTYRKNIYQLHARQHFCRA